MKPSEERAYTQGSRMAWLTVLKTALSNLGYGDYIEEQLQLIAEREEAINTLRIVCRDHGDNDWDEKLHLPDIIDKHLARHLEDE